MAISGTASVEIDAPIALVYEVAADPAIAPKWQPEIKSTDVLERNAAHEQTQVVMETDLKVKTVDIVMRFAYGNAPNGLTWSQEKGPLKSVEGRWTFEDLGGDRTKATVDMTVDLGRLGILIRGPLVGVLRAQLVESMPDKLKGYVEQL